MQDTAIRCRDVVDLSLVMLYAFNVQMTATKVILPFKENIVRLQDARITVGLLSLYGSLYSVV